MMYKAGDRLYIKPGFHYPENSYFTVYYDTGREVFFHQTNYPMTKYIVKEYFVPEVKYNVSRLFLDTISEEEIDAVRF